MNVTLFEMGGGGNLCHFRATSNQAIEIEQQIVSWRQGEYLT